MQIVTKLHWSFTLRCEFALFCCVLYDLGGHTAEYYITLITSYQTKWHHIPPYSKPNS